MEKEISKYYTPEIKDLYIGYICETPQGTIGKGKWKTTIINSQLDWWKICDLSLPIRTKYLDKKDIESLGWIDITERLINKEWLVKFPNTRKKFEIITELDNRWLILYPNHTIAIVAIDICKEMDKGTINYDSNSSREYQGECKSINELKLLMKWLKIKQE